MSLTTIVQPHNSLDCFRRFLTIDCYLSNSIRKDVIPRSSIHVFCSGTLRDEPHRLVLRRILLSFWRFDRFRGSFGMLDCHLFQNLSDASVNRNVIRAPRKENVIIETTSLSPRELIRITIEGNVERHPFVCTEPSTLYTCICRTNTLKLFMMLKYSIGVSNILLIRTTWRERRRGTNGNMRRNLVLLCSRGTQFVLFRKPTSPLDDRTL